MVNSPGNITTITCHITCPKTYPHIWEPELSNIIFSKNYVIKILSHFVQGDTVPFLVEIICHITLNKFWLYIWFNVLLNTFQFVTGQWLFVTESIKNSIGHKKKASTTIWNLRFDSAVYRNRGPPRHRKYPEPLYSIVLNKYHTTEPVVQMYYISRPITLFWKWVNQFFCVELPMSDIRQGSSNYHFDIFGFTWLMFYHQTTGVDLN